MAVRAVRVRSEASSTLFFCFLIRVVRRKFLAFASRTNQTMGQLFARNNGDVEQANGAGPAYCYPPPNGNRSKLKHCSWDPFRGSHLAVFSPGAYFGNRFQLGNETFDTTEPESYLFGDNHDLNFLGRRPSQVRAKTREDTSLSNTPLVSVSRTSTGRTDENDSKPDQHTKGHSQASSVRKAMTY